MNRETIAKKQLKGYSKEFALFTSEKRVLHWSHIFTSNIGCDRRWPDSLANTETENTSITTTDEM